MNTYVRLNSLLKIFEQVDDLRLDRDVERRHRLVADDQLGLQGERARDRRCAGADRPRTRAGSGCRCSGEADARQQLLHRGARRSSRGDAVDRAAARR